MLPKKQTPNEIIHAVVQVKMQFLSTSLTTTRPNARHETHRSVRAKPSGYFYLATESIWRRHYPTICQSAARESPDVSAYPAKKMKVQKFLQPIVTQTPPTATSLIQSFIDSEKFTLQELSGSFHFSRLDLLAIFVDWDRRVVVKSLGHQLNR